jgi:outer membrane beta-barrel protein
MKEVIFGRVLTLAIVVLLPCVVHAQGDTMSFSEDEVESKEAESEGEGTMSFEGEEAASEGDTSGESKGGSDLFSGLDGLSAEADATVGEETKEASAEAGPEEEVKHPIWAVQQIFALKAGRVDLQPTFGISMNDPYMQHQAISVAGSYYITEVLAAGVSFNFYRWMDAPTDLNFALSRATHQTVPINEYFWGGQLNFTYVPFYGKFAMFREWIFHWDVWVIGGGGFIFTRPRPVIDPDYREFDFGMKFCFNVGLGGRLFINRFLAVVLELRDYIYPEELESLYAPSNTEEREDKSLWLDEDYKLTNNVMLHVGVSIFIPFTFDYKLPK